MESVAGGYVRAAAAPDLLGCRVPVSSAPRADRGAGPDGVPDAGAVRELQAASRAHARGASGGRRSEEAPPQQTQPGGTSEATAGPGQSDAHDLLCVSSKTHNNLHVLIVKCFHKN